VAALDASFHAVRAGEGQAPFDGAVIIQATPFKKEKKIRDAGRAPDPVGWTLAHAGQEGLARLPGKRFSPWLLAYTVDFPVASRVI